MTCFTYEGIDAIKEALMAGEAKGTAEAPVKIRLTAPPNYVMTCITLEKEYGIDLLNQAIEAITTVIKSKG